MNEISFRCYKIEHKLPLEKICDFLNLERPTIWKDYVVLQDDIVQTILKEKSEGKRIFLFRFGCVAMADVTETQARGILEYFRAFLDSKIDSQFFAFQEEYSLIQDKINQYKIHPNANTKFVCTEEIQEAIAVVLSRSVEISWFEAELSDILDDTEYYIHKMLQGRVVLKRRKYKKTIMRVLQFEFESISSTKIFDRSFINDSSEETKAILTELSDHFELHERFEIIEGKIKELKNFMKAYRDRAMRIEQKRIYIYEIILIGAFPTMGILKKIFSME